MDLKELKTKSESDLQKLLAGERDHLRELRFKDSSKQLKNVRAIRKVKVEIARILTVLKLSK